jgi:hypothetical protein
MAAFFKKKTSVAAINITLGVPGQRADKSKEVFFSETRESAATYATKNIVRRMRFWKRNPISEQC